MNKRVFQVQGLVTNGVAVGGLASLTFAPVYGDVIESTPDGAFGSEDVDRAGLGISVSLTCSDVSKIATLLDSTPGDTTFWGKESGATTWSKYTIASADGKIVYSGANLSIPKNADGTLTLNGLIRFTDGAKDLEDVLQLTAGDDGSSKVDTYPARLYRAYTASFVPGVDPAIAPLHTESLTLAINAIVHKDYSDTDIGETAVDLGGWNSLQLTLLHRDASDPGAETGDISGKIMAAARGVLTVNLLGRGGAAAKILTVNNLLWTGAPVNHQPGYSDFTLTGKAGWRKKGSPDTEYTLTGTDKLFTIL